MYQTNVKGKKKIKKKGGRKKSWNLPMKALKLFEDI